MARDSITRTAGTRMPDKGLIMANSTCTPDYLAGIATHNGWEDRTNEPGEYAEYHLGGMAVSVSFTAGGTVRHATLFDGVTTTVIYGGCGARVIGTVNRRDTDKRATVAGWLATPPAGARIETTAAPVAPARDAEHTYTVTFVTHDGDTASVAQPGKTNYHAVRDVHRGYGHLADDAGNGTTTYRVSRRGIPIPAWEDVTVNGDGIPFAAWLRAVDKRLGRIIGVSHNDIADWQWYDAWVGCETPATAARDAIDADDTFAGFLAGLTDI